MVKDVDGTTRYESAERAAFSDGSMEQDLPMQQLSEMFNVNHFIVSQANPHAVVLASYNHGRNVWSNPVFGIVNAILSFLKDRCRTWLAHAVELVGARRIAPTHATSRGIASQVFIQEYEGRASDISLIPWISHRGLISAFMHALYNPDKEEVEEWIAAAERETWKHLPAIRSHIAEEVTLDRCVQRLRKRLVEESWAKRRAESTGKKMGERVPSFFTSPSLVNMGGLTISDRSNVEGLSHDGQEYFSCANIEGAYTSNSDKAKPEKLSLPVDINPGWGGMGLRGNRSSGNLERSPSDASGLFIEEMEPSTEQVAGEQSLPAAMRKLRSSSSFDTGKNGYMKTTCMANFYYRNSTSHGNLAYTPDDDSDEPEDAKHRRRKSQSASNLKISFGTEVK